MMDMDFLRRMFSTKRMNLRYFLKSHLNKEELKFKIGKSEKAVVNKKEKTVFNITLITPQETVEGYALLNEKIDGFTLFFPERESAIVYKVLRRFKKGKSKKVKITFLSFKRIVSKNVFDIRNYCEEKKVMHG